MLLDIRALPLDIGQFWNNADTRNRPPRRHFHFFKDRCQHPTSPTKNSLNSVSRAAIVTAGPSSFYSLSFSSLTTPSSVWTPPKHALSLPSLTLSWLTRSCVLLCIGIITPLRGLRSLIPQLFASKFPTSPHKWPQQQAGHFPHAF